MTQCAAHPIISSKVSFSVITLAALADSINPCAIAVLLILLAGLLASGEKKRVLSSGLLFVLGLYLTYFLFGYGIFSALSFVSYARLFHLIVGSFAIAVGAYFLKIALWPPQKGKVCIGGICDLNSLPARIVRRATSPPAAFLAGILITLVELPCTGGPYLFTLGYLSTQPKIAVLPYLLYYNVLFVLPLLVVIGLIYWGFTSIEKTARWKEQNARILNFIAGLLMIGLGIWVLVA